MSHRLTKDLLTNVAEIDKDHAEIINRVNKLFEACHQGKAKDEIVKLMEFMEDHVKTHLQLEEEYMKKYNYKDYTSHAASHAQFTHLYRSLKQEYLDHGSTSYLVVKANDILKNWLLTHVNKEDKALAAFLLAKV